jgi:hypothetical protein
MIPKSFPKNTFLLKNSENTGYPGKDVLFDPGMTIHTGGKFVFKAKKKFLISRVFISGFEGISVYLSKILNGTKHIIHEQRKEQTLRHDQNDLHYGVFFYDDCNGIPGLHTGHSF